MNHPHRVFPPLPVTTFRRLLAVAALAALGACSSPQTMEAEIPPAGRPMWDRCNSALSSYCHRQGQGDPTLDRACEEDAAREYRGLADDDARRRYLTAHSCSL